MKAKSCTSSLLLTILFSLTIIMFGNIGKAAGATQELEEEIVVRGEQSTLPGGFRPRSATFNLEDAITVHKNYKIIRIEFSYNVGNITIAINKDSNINVYENNVNTISEKTVIICVGNVLPAGSYQLSFTDENNNKAYADFQIK